MSALYPPNIHKLSDAVINSVVERRPVSHQGEVARTYTTQEKSSLSNSAFQDLFSSAETSTYDIVSQLTQASLPSQQISNDTTSKSSSTARSTRKRRKTPPLSARAIIMHRERTRRNMARYRQRCQAHEDALVSSVQLLNEEIKKLEVQRRLIASNVPTNTTCWNIVAEYFRLFRYAYKAPNMEFGDQQFPGPTALDVHHQFVQSNMTTDVIGQNGCGVEALLEDYRMASLYQPDLDNRVINLENGFEDSIIASTRVNVTISASTLQHAFPHLVNDSVKWETIGKKLLGQTFLLRGSVEFKWDPDRIRVSSVQMHLDILTPMLEFLGNLEDVASVFESAMILPDCNLVVGDDLHVLNDK